ncbi:DUF488 family protein [Frateuria soli]|uniref:DUF488 domain-containing protein n=1 Tax=Frateuria soli TaxID=1542730 RepID=UPI001E3CC24D|nr:DUF488 domain-containing protein [Frateuria soli]UGB38000.1 DUF488 domain-containing protein [Frateuria soli]
MTVFTIGYEGLDASTFVALLKEHGVDTVIDIRELPLSRKPGFSKRALAGVLDQAGLGYVHMRDLGCPKPVRQQYKQDGSWKHYSQGFLRYLTGQAAALERLADLTRRASCALVCFEADYRQCHRSFVADALKKRAGAVVRHIEARG